MFWGWRFIQSPFRIDKAARLEIVDGRMKDSGTGNRVNAFICSSSITFLNAVLTTESVSLGTS
jgi:hypothetical protein